MIYGSGFYEPSIAISEVGQVKIKREPRPSDSTQTLPPLPVTIFLTIDNPSPVLFPELSMAIVW